MFLYTQLLVTTWSHEQADGQTVTAVIVDFGQAKVQNKNRCFMPAELSTRNDAPYVVRWSFRSGFKEIQRKEAEGATKFSRRHGSVKFFKALKFTKSGYIHPKWNYPWWRVSPLSPVSMAVNAAALQPAVQASLRHYVFCWEYLQPCAAVRAYGGSVGSYRVIY